MYKISYRSTVWQDLDEIVTYLCNELHATAAAGRLLTELDGLKERIAEHPYMYKAYESVLTLSEDYRIAPLGSFVLFYTIHEQTKTVFFCRVLYSRRDFDQLL